MIGGRVIAIERDMGIARLWVVDRRTGDDCIVMADTSEEVPTIGDDVWWQAGRIYWGPDDKKQCRKVANSYPPHRPRIAAVRAGGGA